MKTATQYSISCDDGVAERLLYFPYRALSASDLSHEQGYWRDKHRRHNRLLHGWGVVCGAQVCRVIDEDGTSSVPWKVVIKPGYILGPYGDEIMIDCACCFDLRTRCITGLTGESCAERADPWCSDVYVMPEKRDKLYIAVRHEEIKTRPVRVHPIGCGCDETQCEYSRLRDGYEICVLEECPESHLGEPGDPDYRGADLPDCPECPTEPWVVLAEVKVEENGAVKSIDNCSCRRIVVSHANHWWRCRPMRIDQVKEREVEVGTSREIVVQGEHFLEGVKATTTAADIVIVDTARESRNAIKVTMNIAEKVRPGSYPLTIENPDCNAITLQQAFEVISKNDGASRSTGRGGGLRRPTRKKKS